MILNIRYRFLRCDAVYFRRFYQHFNLKMEAAGFAESSAHICDCMTHRRTIPVEPLTIVSPCPEISPQFRQCAPQRPADMVMQSLPSDGAQEPEVTVSIVISNGGAITHVSLLLAQRSRPAADKVARQVGG
jgi:hypothetical protein